jgi:sterol desaturase/sphingolipid hydroxylase (fatty acid hydroxylase superfamily)
VLPAASLLDLSGLGLFGGAVVGILVYELFHYAYHRTAHAWGWLWRRSHQMHHSAESLDAFGAYYLHPIDVFAFTSMGILVAFPLLGLTPEAGAVTSLFLGFNGMFQHANLRTPRWLGYLIQRPESHGVHHARGVHRWNYSDLPLWDMVFGTFRNPARFEGETGFYRGASGRVVEMLVGRDVTREPAQAVREPVAQAG